MNTSGLLNATVVGEICKAPRPIESNPDIMEFDICARIPERHRPRYVTLRFRAGSDETCGTPLLPGALVWAQFVPEAIVQHDTCGSPQAKLVGTCQKVNIISEPNRK